MGGGGVINLPKPTTLLNPSLTIISHLYLYITVVFIFKLDTQHYYSKTRLQRISGDTS